MGRENGRGKREAKRGAITMMIWRNDRAQLDTQHGSQIYEHIHQWQDCCLLATSIGLMDIVTERCRNCVPTGKYE